MDKLAILLLAAGASTRSGPNDKLGFDIDGRPMLRHVAMELLAADIGDLHIVIGGPYIAKRRTYLQGLALGGLALRGPALHIHEFDHAKQGMGASLAFGVRQIQDDYQAIMVALADMPKISKKVVCDLYTAHQTGHITAPIYQDKRGHPVIFDQCYFDELSGLTGDIGAKEILKRHARSITLVNDMTGATIVDCDRP